MPDEALPVATAETEAPATTEAAEQPPEAAAPEQAQPEPIDFDALEQSIAAAYERDPKGTIERLKKHRAIGGIAGSIAERQLAQLKQQDDQQREAEARQKAMEELEREAEERPLEFADRFRLHRDAEKARERIQQLEQNAAKTIMEKIGESYHGLPEWQNLTDDERTKLREAVAQNVDNPLPAFNRVALDIVADRRAEKRLQDRLPKEKEAWKTEWEAARLASEQSPDLRRATNGTPKRVSWGAVDDDDFNEWFESRYPSAQRTPRRRRET